MAYYDESIYNLIPRPEEQVSKPPMYRSKYNAKIPPSCSTFGLHGTTKLTANESGGEEAGFDEFAAGSGQHAAKKASATMGRETIAAVNPRSFLKRGEKAKPLPPVKQFGRPIAPSERKQPLVKRNEKPVMGLTTEKNFIVANAVENILAVPKRPPKEPEAAVARKTFGKVPEYLKKIKKEVQEEYQYINDMNNTKAAGPTDRMRIMDDGEKAEIIAGLKKKWDETHKQYQALTFNIDTVTKVQRKEGLEVDMEQIEKAIQKLSKKNIYVYDDTD